MAVSKKGISSKSEQSANARWTSIGRCKAEWVTTECIISFVDRRASGGEFFDDAESFVIHRHDQAPDFGLLIDGIQRPGVDVASGRSFLERTDSGFGRDEKVEHLRHGEHRGM